MEKQNKITLSDLMTSEQALRIIDLLEGLEKRLENAENEIQALKTQQTWAPVYETVRMYAEKEEH